MSETAAQSADMVPLSTLVSLAGRVAVVTGGGRGIGLAIGRRLAEAGANVVLADIDADGAAAAARDLEGAVGMPLDARDPASIDQLGAAVLQRHGRLDIWVNNAGVYPAVPALELTPGEWDDVLELDLRGVFFGCQAAARAMVKAGNGGVIINIASTTGLRGYGGLPHYVAAKHGVVGLTSGLAGEFAPHGIRVLGLAPTMVLTPGMEVKRAAIVEAGGTDPAEITAASVPLGRPAVPDDVGRVALFCASELASYLTGITIPVDGGRLAFDS